MYQRGKAYQPSPVSVHVLCSLQLVLVGCREVQLETTFLDCLVCFHMTKLSLMQNKQLSDRQVPYLFLKRTLLLSISFLPPFLGLIE